MSKKILSFILAAAVAFSIAGGIGILPGVNAGSGMVTAEAADTAGTAYDPVLVDEDDTVIVVDPGHGGSDPGAANSDKTLQEKTLTLKIANALVQELETYADVRVYMTRTTDTYVGLTDRTAYAASVGADAFVSVHLNSAAATARGAEVWYPNASFDSNVASVGKTMASNVMTALSNLGLVSRGIKTKDATYNRYSDGSVADYYAVIRGAKEKHIPGIIIEGAFLTNASDVSDFLSTDAKLKAMGKADADAIAETFGLKKRSAGKSVPAAAVVKSVAVVSSGSSVINIKWKASKGASEYLIYRKTGKNGTFKQVGSTKKKSFTDKGTSYGATYYYAVIAKNSAGKAASYQENVSVTTGRRDVTLKAAVDKGESGVKISWKKDPDATGYRVYRKVSGGSFKKLTTIKSNKTSYTDKTAERNTSYYYTVKAYYKTSAGNIWSTCIKPGLAVTTAAASSGDENHTVTEGATDNSVVKNNTVSDSPVTGVKNTLSVQAVPLALTVSADDSSSVAPVISIKKALQKSFCYNSISWKVTSHAGISVTGYEIWRSKNGGSWKKLSVTTKKSYKDKKAYSNPGDVFEYRVRAAITDGEHTGYTDYSQNAVITMSESRVVLRSAYNTRKAAGDATNYDTDVKDWATPASASAITVHWKKVSNATGYQVLDTDGNVLATVKGANTLSTVIGGLSEETEYAFMVRAYKKHGSKLYYGAVSLPAYASTPYVIKGTSKTTPDQMVRYFNANVSKKGKTPYPASIYKKYGAGTIEDFAKIVYEEAQKAGVKAEVLFAQICCETGFLNFGGDVKAQQCNFGGMGAIGNGSSGLDFVKLASTYYSALGYRSAKAAKADAVRIGVSAQAVHLSYYATTDGKLPEVVTVGTINNYPNAGSTYTSLPDPRAFSSIVGLAPYVEWIGIKDNYYTTGEATIAGRTINSAGWASMNNYGYVLVDSYIKPLLAS